jgi:hypothetical protein
MKMAPFLAGGESFESKSGEIRSGFDGRRPEMFTKEAF